jgi:hypothetical protein
MHVKCVNKMLFNLRIQNTRLHSAVPHVPTNTQDNNLQPVSTMH